MREDKRNPVPRGTILVAEGDSATKGTAHPPAGAAPAPVSEPAPGAGEVDGADQAPADADAPVAPPAVAGSLPSEAGHPAPVGAAPAGPRRIPAAPVPEPSWAKVLGTTISLWASRRFQRLTGRSRAGGGGVAARAPAGATGPQRRGIRWPLVAFVLTVVILALAGLQLSGALSQHTESGGATGAGGGTGNNRALSAAQATRSRAATWIAQQVTSSDLIACDPLMCAALQSDGVAASRLMAMQPTATDPLGADVVVATASIRSQFGSQLVSEYAPELMASFGRGASRVDVRAVANFGAAAFQAKEQADLTARKAAGAQLLRNGFRVTAQSAGQIRAGQVDSRVLVTLAALLSQRQVEVGSFGDTGPGAPVLYRQVTIVDGPSQMGTAALSADLSQVRAQRDPYQPAHAAIVQLANGQSALRIEFGAPDQPGLLSGGNS
jgi:hypothetical protein